MLAVLAVCAAVGAGGIGIAAGPGRAEAEMPSEAAAPMRNVAGLAAPVVKAVELGVTPSDGAKAVNPAAPTSVKAINGTVTDVVLERASGGGGIPGTTSPDGSTWTAGDPLEFDTQYTYRFTIVDQAGRETKKAQTFATVARANEADAAVYPLGGSTVGAGQPIEIVFSEPVLNKEALEQAVTVTASSGQAVAWRWYSDRRVRIRPEAFWAANSEITVDLSLFGVDFGNKMIGNADTKVFFKVGPQRLAVVDDITKKMNVYFDGQLVRTAPVTLGDAEWLSPTGFAVIMEQERNSKFNAGSIGLKPGDKGYYPPLTVEYANRLTSSGVYVHQALESAWGAVGKYNVSHGCVGLLPADAAWFFNNMKTGDVVQTLNTGAPAVEPLEGFGDWNIPWAEYAKR
ncbi:Ig-like domain-containing protein [Arthrobacter sp. AL08]|uniref:L,D-transpeptidase n=1 Tax=unclassified Arthrobacter TaxID=235627 RepID=UPI00249BE53A|nr:MULTISPECIES: Ig-like domain-containing protein [unclassified Arthrobacter]MDI3240542.1 Ig-like domain-containing protein [Arthrobacter sp. AL05]MDI3276552.1 Ig-like domain-containing protein [Arthrobacter sp. AL08]